MSTLATRLNLTPDMTAYAIERKVNEHITRFNKSCHVGMPITETQPAIGLES